MPRMIVDSREARSGLSDLLREKGIEVQSEELECADYVLADGLAVERKAASDFVISIEDRRLFSQIAVCKKTYARVFVVVEGDVFKTRSTMTEEALLGALSYISLLENVPVIFTANTRQTAGLLVTLQRHAWKALGMRLPCEAPNRKTGFRKASTLSRACRPSGPLRPKNCWVISVRRAPL